MRHHLAWRCHLEPAAFFPGNQCIIFQVEVLCLKHGKNGLGGTVGRNTRGDTTRLDHINTLVFQYDVGGNIQRRIHISGTGCQYLAIGLIGIAIFFAHVQHIGLFACRIHVVTVGISRSLDDGITEVIKGTHRVTHHLATA